MKKVKCAIYARVSTDKQGDSIENQISQAKEYIQRLGPNYEYDEELIFVDEAVSGYYTSVFDRQAMKNAREAAKKQKFHVILFKEISRVGRDKQENPAIIGSFEQYGVRVIAINDNYDSLNKDSLTFDILSVLSEQESRKISARVSSAKKQKAKRGQWNGEPPIGYKVNSETKKLVIDEEKRSIPELIFRLYTTEGLGTFKVAQTLNAQGLLTKNGNLWSRKTINNVLTNRAYIGCVVYGTRRNELERTYDDTGKMSKRKVQRLIKDAEWTIIENAHPPIIDEETFYKAQQILNQRSHHRTPRRAYHPLTGILVCSKCGEGMVCQKRTHNNKEYRYYICKTYHKYGRSACDVANVNADVIEGHVIEVVQKHFDSLELDEYMVDQGKDDVLEKIEMDIKARMKQKEKIQKDQRDLFAQRDLFTEESYTQQMMELKGQAEFIEKEIQFIQHQKQLHLQSENDKSVLQKLRESAKDLRSFTTRQLRDFLHDVINEIKFDGEEIAVDFKYKFS
ncbi:recombinase family protein [Brevibacillus fulvus]|uniref:DNA invertase Pin-like site-specific DNA recombinase n=1 Tax=Brevibacillus fulvus TaxID=1125967 RepID=A0A938XZR1_9BACL|nr:recombinase family protein [Brevibacillus fulvus]MBM7591234.1 DNA invertase Pin-like site-specific DNA recombinase [Brevibacillus fulvus]